MARLESTGRPKFTAARVGDGRKLVAATQELSAAVEFFADADGGGGDLVNAAGQVVGRWSAEFSNPGGPGLGDMVAAVTRAAGIKPCKGCSKRRRWLNRAMPGRRR